jgi:hypothetical protein
MTPFLRSIQHQQMFLPHFVKSLLFVFAPSGRKRCEVSTELWRCNDYWLTGFHSSEEAFGRPFLGRRSETKDVIKNLGVGSRLSHSSVLTLSDSLRDRIALNRRWSDIVPDLLLFRLCAQLVLKQAPRKVSWPLHGWFVKLTGLTVVNRGFRQTGTFQFIEGSQLTERNAHPEQPANVVVRLVLETVGCKY